MELNNTIATPLYKQLEEKLQHEIETGERPAVSRLPTENERNLPCKQSYCSESACRIIRIRISRPQIRKRNFCRRKEAPPQYNGSHQLY